MQSIPSSFISLRKFANLSVVMSTGLVDVATMQRLERAPIDPPRDRNKDLTSLLLLTS